MPELPEVETIRCQLCEAGVEGLSIEKISVLWPRTVDPLSPAAFCKKVESHTIDRVSRHGKWLIFELDCDENLLVHLRMTGGFYLSQGIPENGSYDRVVLQLSGGLNLHFRDPRKFGRISLGVFPAGLGPDALEIGARQFFQTLNKTDRKLKVLLLDQSFIAGVGNIYADEALFAARLRPDRRAGSLSDDEKLALYQGVTEVIRAGVRSGGTSLGNGQGNYTDLHGRSGGHGERVKVYGRAGQLCVVCGSLLVKTKIAQRATVFCPHCQK